MRGKKEYLNILGSLYLAKSEWMGISRDSVGAYKLGLGDGN